MKKRLFVKEPKYLMGKVLCEKDIFGGCWKKINT